jgi:peptidoglycan/xylan/chitin deacetylase (PgdA/CDA1 family)
VPVRIPSVDVNRRDLLRAGVAAAGAATVTVPGTAAVWPALDPSAPGWTARFSRPHGQRGSYGVEVIWQLPLAEPTVALSFDDGPDPRYTPDVLDTLKRHGVPATFFTIGIHADAYPDLVRRARDEGHQIGNHTWSHPNLSRVTQPEADSQLSRTHDLLGKVAGRPPTLFRPPYGKVDAVGLLAAAAHGYHVALWSETVRAAHARQDATGAVRDIKNGGIVLMHDGGPAASMALVRVLDSFLMRLKRQGYAFATIGGLISASPGPGDADRTSSGGISGDAEE